MNMPAPTSLPTLAPELRHALVHAVALPDGVAATFYRRLFELAPGVRRMFPDDLSLQQDKLTRSLLMLLRCLDEPETLVSALQQLGARHVHYGVQAVHYLLVGQALETAFGELVGDALFDQAARRNWQQLYGWVAATMLAGSAQASLPESPEKVESAG